MARVSGHFVMSAEDLTTQGGIAVQQDLMLATLVGATHVERNGHHYVDGMAGAPQAEQDAYLAAHGDLYKRAENGRARLDIKDGAVSLRSIGQASGLATAVMPDWCAMRASSRLTSFPKIKRRGVKMRTDGLSINLATVRQQWNLVEAVEACARHGITGGDPWRDQVAAVGLDAAVRAIKDNGMRGLRLLPRRHVSGSRRGRPAGGDRRQQTRHR